LKTLTDYLDESTLKQLQDAFSAVVQSPILVCRPDGAPYVDAHSEPYDWDAALPGSEGEVIAHAKRRGRGKLEMHDIPIVIDGQCVGRVRMEPRHVDKTAPSTGGAVATSRLLRLMASMVCRLCDREQQLHTRVEELATLYRLTSEFSGQRDIDSLLDLVVRTVVQVLRAKACSIRLLSDDGRELLPKAVANLSVRYLQKGPLLLSKSQIDQEVLRTGKPVYIADERTDPRVVYPAEARQEGIVSALCVPLSYRGRGVGVLRVYKGTRHVFDWFEVSLTQAICGEAAAAIINTQLAQESVRSERVTRQLTMAAEVQRRMIPEQAPRVKGFDIAGIYVPSLELGGDFYDFIELPPSNVGIAICDVVGKGVRASLLMASIRASLRARAMNVYDMSEVLCQVNQDLCSETISSDFATMFYGVIDADTRRFTYANAGHVPPLLIRDGKVCHLTTGGGVLGVMREMEYGHDTFVLQPGDVILAFTDGLTEALNFQDEPFGHERVQGAALRAIGEGADARTIARTALWDMRRFAGLQTRFDDITIVCIRSM